jgi:peptide/nickel transport system substrate-binding protein
MAAFSGMRRRVTRRRVVGLGLGGSAAAALLAACGGDGKQEDGEAGAGVQQGLQQGQQQAQQDETAEGKPGGVYRYRTSTDYPTLDPYKSASFAAQFHGAFVYSRLLAFESGPGVDPRDYDLIGDAAQSWETPDGLTYIFKLRPNNRFHNIAPVNGRALDSGDVKFSYERFTTVSPNQNALLNLVSSMETPDPQTVSFRLKLKYAPFPTQIASASEAFWLYAKEAAGYDPAKVQIGTGPFLFDKDTPSVGTEYSKSPAWWWQGRPYVDKVERIIIPETAQYLAQFIAKRIDSYAPTNDEVLEVRKQVPDAVLSKTDIGTGYGFIYFSGIEDSPFKDPRVRQAVSMALDRDSLLDGASNRQALEKAGIPIDSAWENSVVAPGWKKWWIDPKDASFKEGQYYKFNLAEAKKLLAAAGHANGFKTEYHFTPTRYGQTSTARPRRSRR